MPTPIRFLAALSGSWLVSFGLLRSGWAERGLLLPLAEWQRRLADRSGTRGRREGLGLAAPRQPDRLVRRQARTLRTTARRGFVFALGVRLRS